MTTNDSGSSPWTWSRFGRARDPTGQCAVNRPLRGGGEGWSKVFSSLSDHQGRACGRARSRSFRRHAVDTAVAETASVHRRVARESHVNDDDNSRRSRTRRPPGRSIASRVSRVFFPAAAVARVLVREHKRARPYRHRALPANVPLGDKEKRLVRACQEEEPRWTSERPPRPSPHEGLQSDARDYRVDVTPLLAMGQRKTGRSFMIHIYIFLFYFLLGIRLSQSHLCVYVQVKARLCSRNKIIS